DPTGFISALGIDTGPVPSTLYGLESGYNTGVFIWKSVDAGNNGDPTPAPGSGSVIQIDTTTKPSTVYLGVPNIAKSVDGGNNWTPLTGSGIGAIVVDTTTANATTPGTLYAATSTSFSNAFVAEVNPSGSALLFSTYLGGINLSTGANAIALDGLDNIYVTGATSDGPISYFPEVNAFQRIAPSGQAAFFTMFG